jgi:hypothetical protein
LEAEKEAIHAAKEMEIAKMRAAQEKAMDNRSAMDELRAKRSQEAADRKWRQQQKEAEEKRYTC